ncbi:unnamed protein product [Haemonchus placei]|uniref:ULP_PROTEASE domain-containing protein n=1 Tax=Haemonchus placei TaxID=6290 RepID=A0A0N4WCI5_HAEPC|nr:unnamed protein product [Haemonchus placei]
MSDVSSVQPSDSASNVHTKSAHPDDKVMEAVKGGRNTSGLHGTHRVDLLSEISEAIADDKLTNNMSVVQPALVLLENRGVHALHGPTLFAEYWTEPEEADDTVGDSNHFEYRGEARHTQFGQMLRWEKVACALLNATIRVCASSGGAKFAGHLALIDPPQDLDAPRIKRMLWCAKKLKHTVVPYCVVTNFWAVCSGREPKPGYEEMLSSLTAILLDDHKNLIKQAKAGEGSNSLKNVRRANYTEISPIGPVRPKPCSEGNLPDNPDGGEEEEVERNEEAGNVEEERDGGSGPTNADENEEAKYLGADDPVDKPPAVAEYVAPTRDLPRRMYKKCRVYCDLPAEAIYCDNNRETRSAKVGGRMIATLTESEATRLPGVVLSAPVSTTVDELKLLTSVVSLISSQQDMNWRANCHSLNRIFPIGLQICSAQKWFPFIQPTVARQSCLACWVSVWLRCEDRYIAGKIRQLDPGMTLEVTVNGSGLKPQMAWYQFGGADVDMDVLYKDLKDAHENGGLYIQADDLSYYDMAVCADLLCPEAALKFNVTLKAAQRPIRPWSNCVKMTPFFGKVPTLSFGTHGMFQGGAQQNKPYEDWLQANRDRILSANEYKNSILRIAILLEMTEQCTIGYLIASFLMGGQGLRDAHGCEMLVPLSGLCIGGDIVLPRPSFTAPLAYLYTDRATAGIGAVPEVAVQFCEQLDRIMAAMTAWNCSIFIAAQAWHITQEILLKILSFILYFQKGISGVKNVTNSILSEVVFFHHVKVIGIDR